MSEQPQDEPRNVAQVLEQAKNAGALYHHISWAMKLLGHDPAQLPVGVYALAFKVLRHEDAGVTVPEYSLVKIEEDQA